jgi:hypothetical protein
MAFFEYNAMYKDGWNYLYAKFLAHFTWDQKTWFWKCYKKNSGTISCMYHCSPVSGKRYYLWLLLTIVRGAWSFIDLYFVDGVHYLTYQAACIARGLAKNDQEWFQCFDEVVLFTLGKGLRTLFLTGLHYRLIADPLMVWDRYKRHFCDDLWH